MSTQLAHIIKTGPAFNHTPVSRPVLTSVKSTEAIQKPAHLCGVEVFTPPFQFGDRVVRDHDLYTFGTVVGMVFHPSTHEPYWEFFVQWDSNLPGNTVSETPCVPVQGYGYTYWHGKPKTASYYDADAILRTGEVYVCSTCGERHLNDTGVCDRCQELEDSQQ